MRHILLFLIFIIHSSIYGEVLLKHSIALGNKSDLEAKIVAVGSISPESEGKHANETYDIHVDSEDDWLRNRDELKVILIDSDFVRYVENSKTSDFVLYFKATIRGSSYLVYLYLYDSSQELSYATAFGRGNSFHEAAQSAYDDILRTIIEFPFAYPVTVTSEEGSFLISKGRYDNIRVGLEFDLYNVDAESGNLNIEQFLLLNPEPDGKARVINVSANTSLLKPINFAGDVSVNDLVVLRSKILKERENPTSEK